MQVTKFFGVTKFCCCPPLTGRVERGSNGGVGVRGPGRPTSIHKWLFYVDESVPVGESSRFACTGAPVLRALGPSTFQLHRIDKRFTCTRGNLFLAVLLAFVPGWPRLGFDGIALRGPMSERCRFLSFYVDESVPVGESSRFACTGAYVGG
jgi:hypothetical protein